MKIELQNLRLLSPKSREHMACKFLQENLTVVTQEGAVAASMLSRTEGHRLKVQIVEMAGSSYTSGQVQCSMMIAVTTALNLSNSQVATAAKVIWLCTGNRKAVEASLKETLGSHR